METAARDETPDQEIIGTLRWNDLEGGFWSLELDGEDPDLGSSVILSGFELPANAEDGARVRARGRARHDLVDFLMSGVRFEVHEAALA